MRKVNVAIDGLAASGKSTVAEHLAPLVGLVYLDTGLMYRAVALKLLRQTPPGAEPDLEQLKAALPTLDLKLEATDQGVRIRLDGQDVTPLLHTPEVAKLVARVAAISEVRRDLVRRQQEFARQGGVMMVGRDIATVVMPQAEVKIFLEASLDERAHRRQLEVGDRMSLEEVKRDLDERDRMDTERADSPLVCVPEAHRVDTTGMTREEVLEHLAEIVRSAEKRTG